MPDANQHRDLVENSTSSLGAVPNGSAKPATGGPQESRADVLAEEYRGKYLWAELDKARVRIADLEEQLGAMRSALERIVSLDDDDMGMVAPGPEHYGALSVTANIAREGLNPAMSRGEDPGEDARVPDDPVTVAEARRIMEEHGYAIPDWKPTIPRGEQNQETRPSAVTPEAPGDSS